MMQAAFFIGMPSVGITSLPLGGVIGSTKNIYWLGGSDCIKGTLMAALASEAQEGLEDWETLPNYTAEALTKI